MNLVKIIIKKCDKDGETQKNFGKNMVNNFPLVHLFFILIKSGMFCFYCK